MTKGESFRSAAPQKIVSSQGKVCARARSGAHIRANIIARQIGAAAMTMYVLDAVLWMIGIRGHVPRNGDFGDGSSDSSPAPHTGRLVWIRAAIVVSVALLSLAMWAAVWLAIRLP
jgi:hypothetical protein